MEISSSFEAPPVPLCPQCARHDARVTHACPPLDRTVTSVPTTLLPSATTTMIGAR